MHKGEALVDDYFVCPQPACNAHACEWVSADYAISPFDFEVMAEGRTRVKVKSTCGLFPHVFHVSVAQLHEMMAEEPYHLYRVYEMDEHKGRLRICPDTKPFAIQILDHLAALPQGVTIDSLSVLPSNLVFGDEVIIDLSEQVDFDLSEPLD